MHGLEIDGKPLREYIKTYRILQALKTFDLFMLAMSGATLQDLDEELLDLINKPSSED